MKKAVLVLASLFAAAPAQAATQQNTASNAVLLQGFDWNSWKSKGWYTTLEAKASDLRDLGVTHVWFPPPSDSADPHGYLPRELFNLNSNYGTQEQLRSAIHALQQAGIQSVADIVINHRVGNKAWADFSNPSWGCETVVNNDEWVGHCGGQDTGWGYVSARDLDHSNPVVQRDVTYFMNVLLKGVGFTGWRYDYPMGYSTAYAKMYNEATSPDFCAGEVWTDLNYDDVNPHRKELVNYIDGTQGTCGVFDFTTKGLLNKVLRDNDFWRLRDSNGKPQGGIGWWAQKMVTFVDNHDSGPSGGCEEGQNRWPAPCDKVMVAYAYILTHPGIPSLYYPHIYQWNLRSGLKALLDARKNAGVTSTSPVSIWKAENGLYAAMTEGTKGRLAMKIGPNDWSPGSGWNLVTSGPQYAVWAQK